jgi:putative ABC transport system permease protein
VAGLSSDLQIAIRGLIRSRVVAGLAIFCLALGIGTSAAMLGLLDALLFRSPAHVKEDGQLKRVYFIDTYPGLGEFSSSDTSYPAFLDLKKAKSFAALGAYTATDVSLGRGAEARKAHAVLATPSFLRLLGVKPVRGRLFLEDEGEPDRPSFVVLISHDLWRRGFGGAADILGKRLVVGRDLYTIVGVLPSRFTGVDLARTDLWLPMNAAGLVVGRRWASSRGSQFLEIVGRLRSATPEAATAEATVVYRAASAEAGEPSPAARISLGPIQRARGPDAPSSVRVVAWLSGLSWIVLLVSCANVASLLLVRALDRRRELALRLALGAGAGRLARMMLFESGLLAAAAGVAALVVFGVMSSLLQRLVLPAAGGAAAGLSPRIMTILLTLTVMSALLSGVAPALWTSRVRLSEEIRTGVREAPRSRLHAAVAAAQIALTFVLLAAAGELARSLYNVLHLDLGFDAERVLVATVDLEGTDYPPPRVAEIFRLAAERIRRLPGVDRAGLAATIPFATSYAAALTVPGVERLPQLSTGGPYLNAVCEELFAATGTSVLRGRAFTAHDRAGSTQVAIVNQTMARLLWPGRQALGQCLRIGDEKAPCSLVVGIVEDARRAQLREEPTMQYYVPLGQEPRRLASRALFVRATGEPEALSPVVRRELLGVASNLPYVEVQPLADLLAPQIHPWRMGAEVLTLFSLLALGLAMVGLYGVVAHSMARRTYELGVRIALGAEWRHVLWLALRQGLLIGLTGAAAGLLLTLAAGRFLQPLLFEVSARDPWTLASATATVLLVAIAASYTAGRRVRRLDPAAVLRVE